jgi:hypothetical protein
LISTLYASIHKYLRNVINIIIGTFSGLFTALTLMVLISHNTRDASSPKYLEEWFGEKGKLYNSLAES